MNSPVWEARSSLPGRQSPANPSGEKTAVARQFHPLRRD
jgi:hypothetical protein